MTETRNNNHKTKENLTETPDNQMTSDHTVPNDHAPKIRTRKKLWDSFLGKARQIRIKRKDKQNSLPAPMKKGRRSSSQPNIPSSTHGSPERSVSQNFPGSFPHTDPSSDTEAFIRKKTQSQSISTLSSPGVSFDEKFRFSDGDAQNVEDGEFEDEFPSQDSVDFQKRHWRSFKSYESSDQLTFPNESLDTTSLNKDDQDDQDKDEKIPVIETKDASLPGLVKTPLSPHAFYMLHVHLKEGKDLVIRDSCGTSDPYVKFKLGNKQVHRSRTIHKNLNPKWDEQFEVPVDDMSRPLSIKVFDYDRAWNDDPMGGFDLDLSTLETNKETDLKLMLSERGKEEYMGFLSLTVILSPKSEEDKEQFFRRSMRTCDTSKKLKLQPWASVVNIVLVEGSDLVSMDDNGLSDPYVKFRLGNEKYRSKFKLKTLSPRWLEQFDLRLYDDQGTTLELAVYDHDTRGKDDFMGRAVIDISQLERERTHSIDQQLEDGAGTIKLLLTVTGIHGNETSSDLSSYTPSSKDRDTLCRKYGFINSFSNMSDLGHLEVKVFRAHGLPAADFGGFSDPFCVLELVNDRLQTQTEYKTLNPEWAKIFTFQVKDIHSVLEVTIFDEDRNKKVEFLGKVCIPLLRVKSGERRWYALKDRKMVHKTKGAVLLEMDLVFNPLKAAVRTVNPREEKYMEPDPKFKISIMKQNINRVSQLIGVFFETGRFIQSCFDWQSPSRTITAFFVYLIVVWNFEIYMLPISLLLIFAKNLLVAQIVGSFKREPVEDEYPADEDDDDDDDKDKTEERKSIMERYHAIQEVCLQVQQGLDTVACLGERVKNTFNWSVPWLSTLAVLALAAAMIVLFYIPVRYLLLVWGVHKFTKKLRKPNAISNNELLDFLSRVPSDRELVQFRELRPDIPANTSSKKKRS